MDSRVKNVVLICDNDADHSFTVEGELRNRNYEVVVLTDATELVESAKSLRPVAVIANPDMNGFNEYDVCKKIKEKLNIPVLFILDPHSTHRANLDECIVDDVLTKPVEADILANLIAKQMAWHKTNP